MSFLKVDAQNGSWGATKILPATANGYRIAFQVYGPPPHVFSVPTYSAEFLDFPDPSVDTAYLFYRFSDGAWESQGAGSGVAAWHFGSGDPNAVIATVTPNSGTLWDIEWNGIGFLFTDTAVDLGVTTSDPFPFTFGAFFGPAVTNEIYYLSGVLVRDAVTSSIVFSNTWDDPTFAEFDSIYTDGSPVVTSGLAFEEISFPFPEFTTFTDGDQEGVCIAFQDPYNEDTPTWYRIDDPDGVNIVKSWSVDRGRSDEMDKSKTGTASIEIVDRYGYLDPTNTSSPVYGYIDPLRQVSIRLRNATTLVWHDIYRGFIDELNIDVDVVENRSEGTIECVDAFAILARTEVVPDTTLLPGSGGTGAQVLVPTDSTGDVFYEDGAVDDRIRAALADANWPSALTVVFSGNVNVQETVYAVRDTILQIIQDAADAEFPGVANVYVDRKGRVVFHGRLAKFDPEGVSADAGADAWDFQHWYAGDDYYVSRDSPATIVPLREIRMSRGMNFIINAALATPKGIVEGDIEGQVSVDAGSITTYGVNSSSWQDLITKEGKTDGLNAKQETKLFADYYKNNYADPRTRVSSVSFGNIVPSADHYADLWNLLCQIDISDKLTLKALFPWGGGFNEDYFVEGVSYHVEPLGTDGLHLVTLDVDLSPTAYFTSNPFS